MRTKKKCTIQSSVRIYTEKNYKSEIDRKIKQTKVKQTAIWDLVRQSQNRSTYLFFVIHHKCITHGSLSVTGQKCLRTECPGLKIIRTEVLMLLIR